MAEPPSQLGERRQPRGATRTAPTPARREPLGRLGEARLLALLEAMLAATLSSLSGDGVADEAVVLRAGLEKAVRACGALGGLIVRDGPTAPGSALEAGAVVVASAGRPFAHAAFCPGTGEQASVPPGAVSAPIGDGTKGRLVLWFSADHAGADGPWRFAPWGSAPVLRSTKPRPPSGRAADRVVGQLSDALDLGLRVAAALCEERSHRLRSEAQAEEALLDPLTRLPNRRLFLDRLDQAVARADRTGSPLAVVFMDMDGFKYVNDSLGHGAGDQLLIGVAERLRAIVRAPDTVARMGGDEFALLLEALAHPSRAEKLAQRITEALEEPFVIWGKPVSASASLGIALRTAAGEDATDLLRHADLAMYRAKAHRKGRSVLFEPGMHVALVRRLQVEEDLGALLREAPSRPKEALAEKAARTGSLKRPERKAPGELVLRYQPIVALRTGRLVGFEALVRWKHPIRGLVFPAEFVPVAEEAGLAPELGALVLARATAAAASWLARSPKLAEGLRLAVNVSTRELARPGYVEAVAGILEREGVPPEHLVLEITETAALKDRSGVVLGQLAALRELGVMLALDDFGTGYSSLSQLWRLPATILKVDRAFVAGVAEEHGALGALTRAVVEMGKELGMDTVAEGVETTEQLERLVEIGCQYGQGYLFSPPLGDQGVKALLSDWTRTAHGTPVVTLPGRRLSRPPGTAGALRPPPFARAPGG